MGVVLVTKHIVNAKGDKGNAILSIYFIKNVFKAKVRWNASVILVSGHMYIEGFNIMVGFNFTLRSLA